MRVVLILIMSSALVYDSAEAETRYKQRQYKPDWADLDSRPLPQWYDQAKVGIFIHWGVFSVPSFVSEWFWYYWKTEERKLHKEVAAFMQKNYPPDFSYQDFAVDFKAEFFNASKWANLFKASGAKYVVLTSKHHEGFTLWPSKHSFSWNAMDTGPRRDIVAELSKAIRTTTDLKFGLYHSLFEWFNPLFLDDEKKSFRTQKYPPSKTWPDLKYIVQKYQPSIIWSDGDGGAPDTYWNSTDLVAWIYNKSPKKDEIVVNDRWGDLCKHGDFYTCADRYSPGVLQNHKWENCFTIDKESWGFRRNAELEDYMTIQEILQELVTTVSCGGNVLINIGPTKDGIITPIYEERLLNLGGWLDINGEAIFDTSPWIKQNDTANGVNVWYTCKRKDYDGSNPTAPPASGSDVDAVYLITLQWPDEEELTVEDIAPFMKHGNGGQSTVTLLDGNLPLKWQINADTSLVKITFPTFSKVTNQNAWALKVIF